MKFRCEKCGIITLQPESADRVCQADRMVGMNPQENTICGGLLVPTGESATTYECDLCGHLSHGDMPGAKQPCWMNHPLKLGEVCSGVVRPVADSPGFIYRCTHCDFQAIYSGLGATTQPACPRLTGPGKGFVACGRPMEKVGPAPKTITWRKNPFPAMQHVVNREPSLAERYPQYYKDVRHLDVIDVYQVHNLFPVDDPTGCLPHASKKLLLCGVRTGNKPKRKDIEEARDTLTRWLEITDRDKNALS